QTRMAGYQPYFGGAPALFEEVEMGVIYEEYAQAATFKQRLRYGLTWAKHRHYMAGLMAKFAAVTVASEPERELLRRRVGGKGLGSPWLRVELLPNCIDVAAYADVAAAPQPDTLIYTGSFSFAPNYEAMKWFILQVWPLVLAQVPQARLVITGNQAGRQLPPGKHVQHVGFVDDVRTYVAGSWVSLAPLQTGGGTRLKILEAMALHTPVVATSKGAQGLDAQPGEHFLQADEPQAFADEVARLLQDADLRRTLTEKAYELVWRMYDYTAVTPKLLHLIDEIAHAHH
ncbi:MAG: glycosyltransferase, partial [Anaerolineales bacterium]|nr:glycosyltransferase [Anaerolineales bacterium]